MSKIKFNAKTEVEYRSNLKHLQSVSYSGRYGDESGHANVVNNEAVL